MTTAKTAAWLIALASWGASTSAFGALGAHYLGTSRNEGEFRLYLDGGEFLGRTASFHSIRVAVHQRRKGHPLRALGGCVYRFDDTDRQKDRIECATNKGSPLSGVAYARDPRLKGAGADADALSQLVCVRRCSPQAPLRLTLENAEEDNG
ncbi:MAG: hypothetical protein ACKVOT_00180 [Polaromonas sp.]